MYLLSESSSGRVDLILCNQPSGIFIPFRFECFDPHAVNLMMKVGGDEKRTGTELAIYEYRRYC
jgi:hypothetical protein